MYRHSSREPGCMEATTQDYRAMWTKFTLAKEAIKWEVPVRADNSSCYMRRRAEPGYDEAIKLLGF